MNLRIYTNERLILRIKNSLFILVLSLFSSSVNAQLHHQSVGALGSSQVQGDYLISHSVGQSSSVIGNSKLTSMSAIQGYQHLIFHDYSVESFSNAEGIKFYPNPFSTQLNFEFESEYDHIQITIIDVRGRIVMTTTMQTSNKAIVLPLPFLSDSEYIISLLGQNLNFQTKIIKKL
ncbi:MAG: T9SS type A sorting domain-containing protein [Flavobacteriaceae bacterium]|jgi:hypothetical protein|nr:T9SS type A sorting domain-containing protein [Flavobacteriaceae bacterium]